MEVAAMKTVLLPHHNEEAGSEIRCSLSFGAA